MRFRGIWNHQIQKGSLEYAATCTEANQMIEDLKEEEDRAAREDISEDELTIFDLLRQGKKLNDREKHAVKDIAQELF